jgi:hypothetical protein
LGELWQTFAARIGSWHAPLGRYSPFIASLLFAGCAFTHSTLLRRLGYSVASVLVFLIAVDLANSLLEREPVAVERERNKRLKYIPVSWPQFVLTGVLATLYTWFVFVGLGAWTPLIFALLAYPLSCLVAWRNVRLWYQQGVDYEEVLKEEEELQRALQARANAHSEVIPRRPLLSGRRPYPNRDPILNPRQPDLLTGRKPKCAGEGTAPLPFRASQ